MNNIEYSYQNFGPFVMKTKMPKDVIERLLKDGKKLQTSYHKQLAGHVKGQYLYSPKTQEWFYNIFQPYFQKYREGHCKFHGIEEKSVAVDAQDLWVNFMKPGDFNPIHTHGGDYSFVLFLDIPYQIHMEQSKFEGTSASPGTLMFEYTQMARPRWATTGSAIRPNTGELYIFPALLRHWVAPFKSKCTRVSVSGNLQITNRDDLPHDYF